MAKLFCVANICKEIEKHNAKREQIIAVMSLLLGISNCCCDECEKMSKKYQHKNLNDLLIKAMFKFLDKIKLTG